MCVEPAGETFTSVVHAYPLYMSLVSAPPTIGLCTFSIYLYLLLTPYLLYVHICWRHAQVLYMPIHCRHMHRFYMCIQCRHVHIHCSCDPCTNISYYIYSYCKHKCRLCTYIATVNSCSFTVYVHPLYTQIFCKCLSNVAMYCCRHIHKHSRYLSTV